MVVYVGRYRDVPTCPNNFEPGCKCKICDPQPRLRQRGTSGGYPSGDKFEGKEIKIIRGSTGRRERFEFYYGGAMYADGPGHGHVVCNDGETINFWRKPTHEGGEIVIDDRWSTERLANHMF